MTVLSRYLAMPLLALFLPLIAQAECTPAANPDLNHDGTVGLQDQIIVSYSFGLSADNPRFNPIADTNCDGNVDSTDILFVRNAFGQTFPVPPDLKITATLDVPDSIRMGLVNAAGLFSVYKFLAMTNDNQTDASASYQVNITHSIQPDTGLSFISLPSTNETLVSAKGSIQHYQNYALKASVEGVYHVTTTATIVETGENFTTETQVQVIDGAERIPSIGLISFNPFALPFNETTKVEFNINIDGILPEKIQSVNLYRTGEISRQQMIAVPGTNGYNASILINTAGMQADDCIAFQADVVVENKTYQSETSKVCVTGFPMSSDLSALDLVKDTVSNLIFVNNELLVRFNDGVSEATMRSIANSVDAVIIENLSLGMYRFKLNSIPRSLDDLREIATNLSTRPEIKGVSEHSLIFKLFSSSIVNDPKYNTDQFVFLETTRVDEAWYVARGSKTIAIIDSGIDLEHEDLKEKIKVGKNFVTPFGSINDDNGHGTAIAGIAAASTNNKLGVAGMSWDSSIYASQVTNALTRFGLFSVITPIRLPSAIADAAKNARIINISLGSSEEDIPKFLENWICDATTGVINDGTLVVAAAGNDGDGANRKNYPAACSGVIAVGGVTNFLPKKDLPGRNKSSQHGSWVDIAASSFGVYTTFPTNGCELCNFNYDPTGYGEVSVGTSFAAPQVAAALAILANRHPAMKPKQLFRRLVHSGLMLPEDYNVGKLLDVFEAVFNGDFELTKIGKDTPEEWKAPDYFGASSCTVTDEQFGVGTSSHGEKMLLCNNAGAYSAGTKNELDIPEGVTEIPVSFDWKVVAEDLREFGKSGKYENGGTVFRHRPDSIQIELRQMNGGLNAWVFKMTLDDIEKDVLTRIEGDNNWYGTADWQHFSKTIALPNNLGGKYRLQILVTQQGYDNITGPASLKGTTHFFMDRLRFRETDS